MALPTDEVLPFIMGGLALRRIGQLGVLACLGKPVALSTEEMLSFSLGRLVLRRFGRLGASACLGKTEALSTKEVLSFGLVGHFVQLSCTLVEGEHCSTSRLCHHDVYLGYGVH